jgi:RNA polymerase sigma-70 factor (ECF subfamily)
MLIATREFEKFRGESERELRAWLLKILSNQVVDGLRRYLGSEKRRLHRETRGESTLRRLPKQAETASQEAALREDAVKLMDAIALLPDEFRDIVQARYLEGLTFPEIAARLSIPVTTCRRRWLEAIDWVRRHMGVDP